MNALKWHNRYGSNGVCPSSSLLFVCYLLKDLTRNICNYTVSKFKHVGMLMWLYVLFNLKIWHHTVKASYNFIDFKSIHVIKHIPLHFIRWSYIDKINDISMSDKFWNWYWLCSSKIQCQNNFFEKTICFYSSTQQMETCLVIRDVCGHLS